MAFLREGAQARALAQAVARIGPRRFARWLQAEGLRSAADDWEALAAVGFEAGFAALAAAAAAAGWGRWALVTLDRERRRAVLRIEDGWEAALQRAARARFGPGLVAAKLTGLCERLFETGCRPLETRSSVAGDGHDEIVVEAAGRPFAAELDLAEALELRRLLADLEEVAAAEGRAQVERERHLLALQERVRVAAGAGAPAIVRVEPEVLAVPLGGAIDEERAARVSAALLATLVDRRAGLAIVDVAGVESVDPATAAHVVRLLREVQRLGLEGVLSGIGPQVALALVELRVDLSGIRAFPSLREALERCVVQAPGRPRITSEDRV